MKVEEIVEQFLRANKFDGLCNDSCGCGCVVDDLCPNIQDDCEAGYKLLCTCGDWVISISGESECIYCRE